MIVRTLKLVPLVLALVLATSASGRAQLAPAPEPASRRADKPVVSARHYMVVTANPHATEAGRAVLAAGGSAIDAMVAVQMVLNLAEPQSSGIGGGAFLVYWDAASRRLVTFDGRETAPAVATPAYFQGPNGMPRAFEDVRPGGRSVGVPGTLALMDLAHRLYGVRPWQELLQPAIDLAEAGFPISPRLAGAIAESAEALKPFAATKGYFLRPDGTPKPAGSILTNPAFARTLRTIAAEGPSAFYHGPIGRALVDTVRDAPINPGLLTDADLAGYRVKLRAPVCAPYRAYQVCGMGPPSSGAVTVGQILGILGHEDMSALGPTVDGVQALLEASKLAFADRDQYLADPDFVDQPLPGLLDPNYLMLRAQELSLDQSIKKAVAGNPPWPTPSAYAPDRHQDRPGTSQVTIVDAAGSWLSLTTTIESGFGSQLMTGGFLLNNELTDFSFEAARSGRPVANRVEGGKRPRSSMAPTIVLDATGEPVLALGSPGGSQIIGYVAQTLTAILDWHMTPQAAVSMGHVLSRNGPAELEQGTNATALADALTARGQTTKVDDLTSGLHVIMEDHGRLVSGVDPRREGAAAGE